MRRRTDVQARGKALSCLGIEAGPSVFLLRAHALAVRAGGPEMEKPNPNLPFAASFDLFDPALWRFRPRQTAPETSDVNIGGEAKRTRLGQNRSSRIEKAVVLCQATRRGWVNGWAGFAPAECK